MLARIQTATRRRTPVPKREPVDWRRYSQYSHRARRALGRREHNLIATAIGSLVFAIAGSLFAQAIGVGLGTGIRDLGGSIAATFPRSEGADLVLGETNVTVSAAPILDQLPEFTKANEVLIEGRVPSFAAKGTRTVVLSLNGQLLTKLTLGTDGRFAPTPITLPDGPSTIQVALVEGTSEIALTSHTITVDRTAPPLTIVRPKAGESVEGPDVIIEGRTEGAADVTVNDRALRPNPDGTFTERLTPAVGPLKVTVIAKDKAGNETKQELSFTVKQGAQTAAGTTLTLTLDRTVVKPSESVVALVLATDGGKPKADLPVTLSVGVVTIGTYRTDATGIARIGFAAPNHDVDDASVVVLGGGTSARTSLTVRANPPTPTPRR